jgi:hypothetical protein
MEIAARPVEKVNLIAAPPHQDLNDITVELALMCHTDTVPYATDWPEALEPHVTDGLLHGCGACDVKGFLALSVDVDCRKRFIEISMIGRFGRKEGEGMRIRFERCSTTVFTKRHPSGCSATPCDESPCSGR